MKQYIVLACSLFSLSVFADCRDLLYQGQSSYTYRIYVDDSLRDFSESPEGIVGIIKKVMTDVGCPASEVENLKTYNQSCNYINSRVYSYACYLETTHGYYFVTQDLHYMVNITFNIWD